MLLDLDIEVPKVAQTTDFPTVFSPSAIVEDIVMAGIILQANLGDKAQRNEKILRFIYELVKPAQDLGQEKLWYPDLQKYPVMCEMCFSYFGDIIGGAVFHTGCVYCESDRKPDRYFRYSGLAPYYVPNHTSRQATILTSLLLYRYYKKEK